MGRGGGKKQHSKDKMYLLQVLTDFPQSFASPACIPAALSLCANQPPSPSVQTSGKRNDGLLLFRPLHCELNVDFSLIWGVW